LRLELWTAQGIVAVCRSANPVDRPLLLTFIVGVYGMNFGATSESRWAMPKLRWYYGCPLVWLVIVAVAIAILLLFRRRRWL